MKRGTIYWDKSFKDMAWGRARNHNCWRAEIVINGVRYRKRSKDKRVCEEFLQVLIEKYVENK